jgi:transcriptional antiterminator RfaH
MTSYKRGEFWRELSWFVVQTRPHSESLAAASLAELDLDVFFPRIQREQRVCGVWRMVTRPLFPSYLFAQFCPLVSLEAVRYGRGVLRVVGGNEYPIPVEAEVIAAIRARLAPEGFVRFEPQPLCPGQAVAIEQGPLSGWLGKVERECDDGRRAVLLLDAIQQTRVVVDKRWLAAVGQGA